MPGPRGRVVALMTLALVVCAGCSERSRGPRGSAEPIFSGTIYAATAGEKAALVVISAGKVAKRIPIAGPVDGIVVAPVGAPNAGIVYAATNNLVSVVDPASGKVVEVRTQVDAFDIEIAPAGTPRAGTVYVADLDGGELEVIEPGAVRAISLPAGRAPGAITIAPAGTPEAGTVFVTGFADGSISVFAPGATRRASVNRFSRYPILAIAPHGSPRAGQVFVSVGGGTTRKTLVLDPTGQEIVDELDGGGGVLDFAPDGLPGAGTAYVVSPLDKALVAFGVDGEATARATFEMDLALEVLVAPNSGDVHLLATDLLEQQHAVITYDSRTLGQSTIEVGYPTQEMVVAPDGTLVLSGTEGVQVIETVDSDVVTIGVDGYVVDIAVGP